MGRVFRSSSVDFWLLVLAEVLMVAGFVLGIASMGNR